MPILVGEDDRSPLTEARARMEGLDTVLSLIQVYPAEKKPEAFGFARFAEGRNGIGNSDSGSDGDKSRRPSSQRAKTPPPEGDGEFLS